MDEYRAINCMVMIVHEAKGYDVNNGNKKDVSYPEGLQSTLLWLF